MQTLSLVPDSVSLYFPGVQSVHEEDASSAYLPCPQAAQEDIVAAPSVVLARPAGQEVQESSPDWAYFPLMQAVQEGKST